MTPTDTSNPPSNPLLKLGIYDIANLRKEVQQAAQQPYLVEGFIAQRSLSLAVGDSNLGKSPFLYQLAMSIASGKPFLSMPVQPGRVLYMDAENSPLQVEALVTTLADYLGLPDVPKEPAALQQEQQSSCPKDVPVKATSMYNRADERHASDASIRIEEPVSRVAGDAPRRHRALPAGGVVEHRP